MNSAKKNFVKKSCQLLGKVVRELRTRRGSFNSNEIKARSNTFFRTFVRPRAKNLPLFPTRSSKKGRHEFFIKLGIRMPDARVFQGENSLDIEEVGREETAGKVVS